MDTTTAATQASVTVPTIRTWARCGAIAAVKVSGRWVIEPASLAHRIALTAPAKPIRTLSVDAMIAIGGSCWTKGDMDRVYINDWAQYAGLEISQYNTGNISSASLDGHPIANGRAGQMLGLISKVWYDATDGKLHAQFDQSARNASVRLLNGRRYNLDLVDAVFTGIKTAIAAL
jgi:hypothetical protein